MPYSIGLTVFDYGKLYEAGFPTFTGVIDEVPITSAPLIGSSTSRPHTLTFPMASNPPGSPGTVGTLFVTDPSGPGDFFRSGPLPAWPPEPAILTAGTGVRVIRYGDISIPLPIDVDLDRGVTAGVGAATGFMFTPFKIRFTSLAFSASSTTPGAVRARFSGTINYTTLIVPRRTDMDGSVDLTVTPSSDALTPSTLVKATASNLSLSPSFITPLSTVALALIAPALSGALSRPLTAEINAALGPIVAGVRMSVPLTPAGTPLFSAAATVSIRSIAALSGGIIVHAVLAELMPGSAVPPPAESGPSPAPSAQEQLLVTIEPPPEQGVTETYLVSVRRAGDRSPIEDADVTITTYSVIGTAVRVSAMTDAQGLAALEVTLNARYRPGIDPTNTGQLARTPPSLSVSKPGFPDFVQDL